MKTIIGVVFMAAGLGACDWMESPTEEAREANEAIRDDRRPEVIQDELDDIGAGRNDRTPAVNPSAENEIERDLHKAELWLEEARRDVEAGTRKHDAGFDRRLDALEQDIRETRADIDRLPERAGAEADTFAEEVRADVRRISDRIEKIDVDVDGVDGVDGRPHDDENTYGPR